MLLDKHFLEYAKQLSQDNNFEIDLDDIEKKHFGIDVVSSKKEKDEAS